ncbi:hypothetical protein TRFO_05222 [Tritrichomonas foetus]|uniref:Uncharacterized protein n=1 Tax=Tritrichomonas foetus TaxID=1144522 RepID=A0A1J4K8N5_9EUKA|nr:hypothetical protein TRFO_05222 [Tritrichomonas foetus]|eukprot:OHT07571.1 hypothetical protein TRFO_05222 [Tritrichomonas foetus]
MSRRLAKKDEIIKFSANRKIDHHIYIDALLQNLTPNEVEEAFKYKTWLMDAKHYTETQANDLLFTKLATPQNVPPEIWFALEDGNEPRDKEDDDFDPGFEYGYNDYSDDDVFLGDSPQSVDKANLATSTKIAKIGGTFEVWPAERYKLACAIPAEELYVTDLLNNIEIISHDDLQRMMNLTTYVYYDKIGLKEIMESVGTDTEALVMDPPLGKNGFSNQEFTEICKYLKKLDSCFIFIWAEPSHYSDINNAALDAGLSFCDTIAVEILNDRLMYHSIVGKRELVNHSKMIIIYRSVALKREKFVHQKSKDVSYGVCKPCGRSRGRLGTPQVAHMVAESMLPVENQKRIFVELWPTRLSPRAHWKLIDEKC